MCRWRVPRREEELVEAVVLDSFTWGPDQVTLAELIGKVSSADTDRARRARRAEAIKRAVRVLANAGLLRVSDEQVALTPLGAYVLRLRSHL